MNKINNTSVSGTICSFASV